MPRGGVGGGLCAPLGGGNGGGSPQVWLPGLYCLLTGWWELVASPLP